MCPRALFVSCCTKRRPGEGLATVYENDLSATRSPLASLGPKLPPSTRTCATKEGASAPRLLPRPPPQRRTRTGHGRRPHFQGRQTSTASCTRGPEGPKVVVSREAEPAFAYQIVEAAAIGHLVMMFSCKGDWFSDGTPDAPILPPPIGNRKSGSGTEKTVANMWLLFRFVVQRACVAAWPTCKTIGGEDRTYPESSPMPNPGQTPRLLPRPPPPNCRGGVGLSLRFIERRRAL